MLFNSYTFWVFFAIVLLAYRRLGHRSQNRLLLVASYVFYGFWDWRFLSLIFISTIVDYYSAARISTNSGASRTWWLRLSILTNLTFLGVFKYYDFFASELSSLLTLLGFSASVPVMNVLLPVGISFYTFQTMSYTIDVYRGRVEAVDSFLDFALFVCFFPQLVAGPVERTERLMPQILEPRPRTPGDFAEGLYHVLTGLFRKVVVADNMAMYVNAVFAQQEEFSGLEYLLALYAFAFQIYGDFSGYSSIAQGVAKWLNFDLMYNFRMPYFAQSPSEFWQRWHVSLSEWLRDYLYIPLGGNRYGSIKTYRNLMATMVLGGLWHGAGWTFIAWGIVHGLVLCVYRIFRQERSADSYRQPFAYLWDVIRMAVMFHLVCFAWLFFRSESIHQATSMLTTIATDVEVTSLARTALGMFAFFVGPLVLFESWLEAKQDMLALLRVHWRWRAVVYLYISFMILFFLPPIQNEFIYFQF